jgi:oligopeptide/dipeptide ABC transporter ATP-binding protein
MTTLLDIAELRCRFPVRGRKGSFLHAVDGVSFTIARGEAVALVGESGCGKSTLARLVARLIDPESGHIRLDNRDLATIPASTFVRDPARARIQMVFQDAGDSLDPRYTARRAIAEPIRGLTRQNPATRVAEVAALAGLQAELLDRAAHQLSGGQKARVGIARALGPAPDLLILDEPTAALDVSVQALVLRLFDDLRRRLGLSMLFISHDLGVVRLLCSRVLVMYLGQIVESGPAHDLFDTPRHPYTQALVDAVPDPARRGRRLRLSGDIVSAIDPPANACRFVGRCPVAIARCRTEAPVLRAVDRGRMVACHLA